MLIHLKISFSLFFLGDAKAYTQRGVRGWRKKPCDSLSQLMSLSCSTMKENVKTVHSSSSQSSISDVMPQILLYSHKDYKIVCVELKGAYLVHWNSLIFNWVLDSYHCRKQGLGSWGTRWYFFQNDTLDQGISTPSWFWTINKNKK